MLLYTALIQILIFIGNENNFVVRDQCEKRCAGTPKPSSTALPSKSTVDVKVDKSSATTIKTPKPSPPLPTTTTAIPRSKTTLTFHRIRSTTTTTTSTTKPSTNTVSEKVTNPCNLPPDKGEKASPTDSTIIFRWYFDMVAERCVQFYYLGTKGNSNNFEHEDSCLETCGGGMLISRQIFGTTRPYANLQNFRATLHQNRSKNSGPKNSTENSLHFGPEFFERFFNPMM